MKTLIKYTPSQSFKARLKNRAGYDLDNPKIRVATYNSLLPILSKNKAHTLSHKTQDLLTARNALGDKVIDRSLAFLMTLGSYCLIDHSAYAHDHHPNFTLIQEAENQTSTFLSSFWENLPSFSALTQIEPYYLWVGFGAAIILSQGLHLLQQRKILKATTAQNALLETFSKNNVALNDEDEIMNDEIAEDVENQFKNEADEEVENIYQSPFSWQVDGASFMGKVREENQDAYGVYKFSSHQNLLILCDGAGGIKGGKQAAWSATNSILEYLSTQFEQHQSLNLKDLEEAIETARQHANDNDIQGVTTALIAYVEEDQLLYTSLGDGAISLIWPDGMVQHLLVPHHTAGQPSNIINGYIGHGCNTPPRKGQIHLEANSYLYLMSDGASDLFPFEDIALKREKFTNIAGFSKGMLKLLEDARDPETKAYVHHDNMTLITARLETSIDQEEII